VLYLGARSDVKRDEIAIYFHRRNSNRDPEVLAESRVT